jgi:hypothetical protein
MYPHFLPLSGSKGARFLINPRLLQIAIAIVETMAYKLIERRPMVSDRGHEQGLET